MAFTKAWISKGLGGLCAMALGLLCMTATGNAVPSFCDSVSGNLVVNCGFETGSFPPWTLPGTIGNFTVTALRPHTGTFDALAAPDSLILLSQSLVTTPGNYNISFWLFSSSPTTPNNEFDVEFNGTTLFDQTDLSTFNYTEFMFSGTATGSSTTLAFSARNDFANGGLFQLDDVVVTRAAAIPEPTSLALLGVALTGFGVMYWRRRTA